MRRGQILLSITALAVVVTVFAVQTLLSGHHDVVITTTRLGGTALVAIAAGLVASIVPPERSSHLASARARR